MSESSAFTDQDGAGLKLNRKRAASILAPVLGCTEGIATYSLDRYRNAGLLYMAPGALIQMSERDIGAAAILGMIAREELHNPARDQAVSLACYAHDEGQPVAGRYSSPITNALVDCGARGEIWTLELATMRHQTTDQSYLKGWLYPNRAAWRPPEWIGDYVAIVTIAIMVMPTLLQVHRALRHLFPDHMDPPLPTPDWAE